MSSAQDLRHSMVDYQIAARGISEPQVLDAMRMVPREQFVPATMAEFAYEDSALPIEAQQTISQPYIVARMIEAAEVAPGEKVLEIGVGSGYAAAVLSRIADKVYGIERHEELSRLAQARLAELGYDNVEIRTGDGTRGWPEAAPFEAILVAAGGPSVPQPLCRQLAIGGRLVIPVGDSRFQELIRITRTGPDNFEQEDLGSVRFVPLIGAHGWEDARQDKASPPLSLPRQIAQASEPLPGLDDGNFAAAFDRFADARVVLLGEASHGTSEFYRARAAITRRLIERHGFTIVAVEADWPDAAAIDRYVRRRKPLARPQAAFTRFPSWMWRNMEVDAFVGWLRDHNGAQAEERRAGFYGLDLYNLNASIGSVLEYLDRVDPEAAAVARERYACLAPWRSDPASYGRMALSEGFGRCEKAVVAQLRDLFNKSRAYAGGGEDDFLDAAQNARLVANAEAYYRAMYYGAAESWNLRDTHMFETLDLLLQSKGGKAVVWAHNSHIGDARHTEMGRLRGEINLGQLCKERYGERARSIGFGTHGGSVAAASDWDGPMEIKRINPSLAESYERLCHDSGVGRFLLDLNVDKSLREKLAEERLERFIGVIYRPEMEYASHYATASLPQQFDAWVWFDETSPIAPLSDTGRAGAEQTYPFGL